MKLAEISALWEKDSDLKSDDLANEALKISKLHERYYKIFIQERLVLRKIEADHRVLYKTKWEYYSGKLSMEELKDFGWDQFPHKLLRQDVPTYLDGDKDLNDLNYKVGVQKEKVDFLESIIKSLVNRGFHIRAAIDFIKFSGGPG